MFFFFRFSCWCSSNNMNAIMGLTKPTNHLKLSINQRMIWKLRGFVTRTSVIPHAFPSSIATCQPISKAPATFCTVHDTMGDSGQATCGWMFFCKNWHDMNHLSYSFYNKKNPQDIPKYPAILIIPSFPYQFPILPWFPHDLPWFSHDVPATGPLSWSGLMSFMPCSTALWTATCGATSGGFLRCWPGDWNTKNGEFED